MRRIIKDLLLDPYQIPWSTMDHNQVYPLMEIGTPPELVKLSPPNKLTGIYDKCNDSTPV